MLRHSKYFCFRDDYYLYISGLKAYGDTYSDTTKLFLQIRDAHSCFSMPREDFEKHFVISHPDKDIERLLNEYFIFNRHSSRELYSNSYDLIGFLAMCYKQSTMSYDVFYYIDWQAKEIQGKKYRIPCTFDYMPPETMLCHRNKDGILKGFRQRYSWYARLKNSNEENKIVSIEFKPWEVFYTSYFFDKVSPARKSMNLTRSSQWFMRYMLSSGEASAYSKPKTLAVEMARNKRFNDEKRKRDIITAMEYKNFHDPLAVDGLSITRYYDFFYYARFKADIYKVRMYYINEFNEQVLKQFALKNKLKVAPELKIVDVLNDQQIMNCFEEWRNNKVSKDYFLDNIVNKI